MRALFLFLPALFLVAAFSSFSPLASASVLTVVGPIYLTGSGSFTTEDADQDGEVAGISFFATGSNGVDSVSFGGDFDAEGSLGLAGILAAIQNPTTAVGSTFSFTDPLGTAACFNGTGTGYSTCSANIDGITGVPDFSVIGAGIDLVQVYELEGSPPDTFVGPLLAQAYVITTNVVTSVNYRGVPDPTTSFNGTFVMVTPEPRTGLMALIGLLGIVAFRKKSRISRP